MRGLCAADDTVECYNLGRYFRAEEAHLRHSEVCLVSKIIVWLVGMRMLISEWETK